MLYLSTNYKLPITMDTATLAATYTICSGTATTTSAQ